MKGGTKLNGTVPGAKVDNCVRVDIHGFSQTRNVFPVDLDCVGRSVQGDPIMTTTKAALSLRKGKARSLPSDDRVTASLPLGKQLAHTGQLEKPLHLFNKLM